MKKFIGLTIAFILFAGMSGIGTWAYFIDIETSQSNTFAAGTLDLKTDDDDGVTQTIYATNMKPGDTVGPATIVLKNAGTVNGLTVDIVFSYIENDESPNPADMSADATAAQMEVTTLNYGGSSLLGSVSDGNSNGYTDVQDLKNANLNGLGGINASATKNFEIELRLKSTTSGDFQSDGITITIAFTLNQ